MKRRSSLNRASKPRASVDFGGGQARGNARKARFFKASRWMHLCLRSEKAKGQYGLLQPRHFLNVKKVLDQARKNHRVLVAEFVNAGTHLHLKVKADRREDLQNFLRVITTLIARRVTGACRGNAFGRFWDGICYSRVLMSRDEVQMVNRFFAEARRHVVKGLGAQRSLLESFETWVWGLRNARSSLHPRLMPGPYICL